MANVVGTATIATPLREAFSYFAEFANIAEWDPGVVSSTKRGSGRLAVGGTYDVVSRFAGRSIPMIYEVTMLDAPNRICLRGVSDSGQADDDIRFESVAEGTTITWRLTFAPRGIAHLARPVLGVLLRRLARATMDGMREAALAEAPMRALEPID